jgi:acyl carrier protein
MRTAEDFANLVRDEVGLEIGQEDLGASFDKLNGWDSVHLLTLAVVLEKEMGRKLPFADIIQASSLAEIYRLAVG